MDFDVEVSQVLFVGYCTDARDTVPRSTSRPCRVSQVRTHGSAMRRSVSLMMRFGNAIATIPQIEIGL